MKKCSTPSCSETAATCELCKGCYNYVYNATRKGVRWMVHRRSRLGLWQERLDSATSVQNVVHIRRKRA